MGRGWRVVVGVVLCVFALSGEGGAAAARDFERPASDETGQQFDLDNPQRHDTPNDPGYDRSEPDDEEGLSHYAQPSAFSYGRLVEADNTNQQLTLRQVSNKIIHAASLEWDLSAAPVRICHSQEPSGGFEPRSTW